MIQPRFRELIDLASQLGLDFFDIKFEEIPWDVMNEIAAYGLPIRAHHWSYGKVYQRQRVHGRMGLSKIYEIVLNNDPTYAFLLDSNTEVENMLVVAHVAAHADFFKNNVHFQQTNRNMVNEAAFHAARAEEYKAQVGSDRVERLMDAAFALDRHIDPHKGLYRKPYPGKQVVERPVVADPYSDLLPEGEPLSVRREVVGGQLPPHPERDILWFLSQYAPLEEWERDLLEMIREESYYFYPQAITKIINEGWASYWHAEVMHRYDRMTPDEMLDFSVIHGNVVRPAGRFQINPYYLGYQVLVDIKDRWDTMYKEGKSKIDGTEKLFEVRTYEDDFSFLRNFLTEELAEKLNLFTYGPACECPPNPRHPCPRCNDVVVKSRDLDAVLEELLVPRYNYGVPKVVIVEAGSGSLKLRQEDTERGPLDRQYAEKTMEYLHEIWKGPVYVSTVNDRHEEVELSFDDRGFRVVTKGRRLAR